MVGGSCISDHYHSDDLLLNLVWDLKAGCACISLFDLSLEAGMGTHFFKP